MAKHIHIYVTRDAEQARKPNGQFGSGGSGSGGSGSGGSGSGGSGSGGSGSGGSWGKDPSTMSREAAVKELKGAWEKSSKLSAEGRKALKERAAWIEKHHPGAGKEALHGKDS